jgi:hypothetical protein
MVLATSPPADRKELFKEIAAPVRLADRLIGRRMYRKQYSTLYLDATFPRRCIPGGQELGTRAAKVRERPRKTRIK